MKKGFFSAILVLTLSLCVSYANQIDFKGNIVEYTCDMSSDKDQTKCALKISETETKSIEPLIAGSQSTTQILMLTYH